jgi:hypothetical protein
MNKREGKKEPRTTATTKPAGDPPGNPLGPRTAAANPLHSLRQPLFALIFAKVVLV